MSTQVAASKVTLEKCFLIGPFRSYPGFLVDVRTEWRGVVLLRTLPNVTPERWEAIRWHDDDWTEFHTKQAAIDWIAQTAKPRPEAEL